MASTVPGRCLPNLRLPSQRFQCWIRKPTFTNLAARAFTATTETLGSTESSRPEASKALPHIDPRFQYGDVIVFSNKKGERRLIGPLKEGGFRDNNVGRLNHDSIIGKTPLSTVRTHLGAEFTLHWPSLDEYCTNVKRQATIMYPKDATTAVHLLDLFPGAHVLEAGTGNGSMTMYIQRAIQGLGSHLDTVDIRDSHSMQAEKNIERFWRGMYRPGITFWRSAGGLRRVIKRLTGEDQGFDNYPVTISGSTSEEQGPVLGKHYEHMTAKGLEQKESTDPKEVLPPNPHPKGHQYDAISLDLPDTLGVLNDLLPLLKPDRPMCLYMVNMSQVLELVQWMRKNSPGYSVEKVLEVGWKEWSVRSAAVRSKVKGRVHVGGFGDVSPLKPSSSEQESSNTEATDHIPDDAVGWVCRPLHMPIGHTGFLVQLRRKAPTFAGESNAPNA